MLQPETSFLFSISARCLLMGGTRYRKISPSRCFLFFMVQIRLSSITSHISIKTMASELAADSIKLLQIQIIRKVTSLKLGKPETHGRRERNPVIVTLHIPFVV